MVNGVRWGSITHTTSTYGVRRSVLEEDAWLIQLAMYAGGPFAHSTSAAIQGVRPFSNRSLHRDLNLDGSLRGLIRAAARPPARAAVNFGALVARRKSRLLMAPHEDLATHVESAKLSPGEIWREIATEFG
jgi:hypothetical protein